MNMEEFLKDDKFVQYIWHTYLPSKSLSKTEKVKQVFSSMEEFSIAMDSYMIKNLSEQNSKQRVY